jgi:hypothetical protein
MRLLRADPGATHIQPRAVGERLRQHTAAYSIARLEDDNGAPCLGEAESGGEAGEPRAHDADVSRRGPAALWRGLGTNRRNPTEGGPACQRGAGGEQVAATGPLLDTIVRGSVCQRGVLSVRRNQCDFGRRVKFPQP